MKTYKSFLSEAKKKTHKAIESRPAAKRKEDRINRYIRAGVDPGYARAAARSTPASYMKLALGNLRKKSKP